MSGKREALTKIKSLAQKEDINASLVTKQASRHVTTSSVKEGARVSSEMSSIDINNALLEEEWFCLPPHHPLPGKNSEMVHEAVFPFNVFYYSTINHISRIFTSH